MASLERKPSNNSLFDFFEDGKAKPDKDTPNRSGKQNNDGLRIKDISLSPIDNNTPADVDVMCISTTPKKGSEHDLEDRHGEVSESGMKSRTDSRNTSTCSAYSRSSLSNYSEDFNSGRSTPQNEKDVANDSKTMHIVSENDTEGHKNTEKFSKEDGEQGTNEHFTDKQNSVNHQPSLQRESGRHTPEYRSELSTDDRKFTSRMSRKDADSKNRQFESYEKGQKSPRKQNVQTQESGKEIIVTDFYDHKSTSRQGMQATESHKGVINKQIQKPESRQSRHNSDSRQSRHNSEISQSRHNSESRQSRHYSEISQSRHNSESRQSRYYSEISQSRHNSESRQSRHNPESRQSRHNSESRQSRHNSESRQSPHSRNKLTKGDDKIHKTVTPTCMKNQRIMAGIENSICEKISTTSHNVKDETCSIEDKQQQGLQVPETTESSPCCKNIEIRDIEQSEKHQHEQLSEQRPEKDSNMIAKEMFGREETIQPGPCKNKEKSDKTQHIKKSLTRTNGNCQRKKNIIKKPLNACTRKSFASVNTDRKFTPRKSMNLKSNTTMVKTPSINNNSKAKPKKRYKLTSTETSGNDSVSEAVVNVLKFKSNPSYTSDEFESNSDQIPMGSSTSGHSFNFRYSSSLQNSPYNSSFSSKSSRRIPKGLSLPYIHNTVPGQIVRGSTHTIKGSSDSDISSRQTVALQNQAKQKLIKKPKLIAQKMGDCGKPRVPIQLKADAMLIDGQLEISVTDKEDVEIGTDNLNVKITLVHKFIGQKPKIQLKFPQKLKSKRQNVTNREVVKQRAMWPAFNTRTNKEASDRYYRSFGD